MQGQGSRLLGLAGFAVADIADSGDQLDLQVELIARAERCPRCAGGPVAIKERPVVAVRDLAIGDRATILRWRKRRYRCASCRRTVCAVLGCDLVVGVLVVGRLSVGGARGDEARRGRRCGTPEHALEERAARDGTAAAVASSPFLGRMVLVRSHTGIRAAL
jgi:hypothetical protein